MNSKLTYEDMPADNIDASFNCEFCSKFTFNISLEILSLTEYS